MKIDTKFDEEKEKEHSAILRPSVAKGRGIYFWVPKNKTDLIDPDYDYLVKFKKYKKREKKDKN